MPASRNRTLVVTALLFAIAAPQFAKADTVSFFSTGRGKLSCADYLRASDGLEPNTLQVNQRAQRTFVSENAVYDQWILGFFSAMNLASAADRNGKPDIQVSNADLIGWVRGWCAAHPAAPMFEGAYSFVKDQWAQRGGN